MTSLTPGALLSYICYAFVILILIRIVFSYIEGPFPRNSIHVFAFRLTEPLLRPIRNVLPPTAGFDFSPTVLMIGFLLVARLVS